MNGFVWRGASLHRREEKVCSHTMVKSFISSVRPSCNFKRYKMIKLSSPIGVKKINWRSNKKGSPVIFYAAFNRRCLLIYSLIQQSSLPSSSFSSKNHLWCKNHSSAVSVLCAQDINLYQTCLHLLQYNAIEQVILFSRSQSTSWNCLFSNFQIITVSPNCLHGQKTIAPSLISLKVKLGHFAFS